MSLIRFALLIVFLPSIRSTLTLLHDLQPSCNLPAQTLMSSRPYHSPCGGEASSCPSGCTQHVHVDPTLASLERIRLDRGTCTPKCPHQHQRYVLS